MLVAARCAAIIPCLDEAASIGAIVRALRLRLPVVFVVDDGSKDRTSAVAGEAGATVIRQDFPRGKGAALRAGLLAATSAGFERALLLDGDGQHAPEDAALFLESAEVTGAELIVGNRLHAAERMPWLRRWVNRGMSWDLSRWTRCHLPDSQCGFRLVELAAWNRLRPGGEGFLVESEMILAFAAAGCRVVSVPVQVLPRGQGQSRIHPVRDTLRWARWRWNARRRFPVRAGAPRSG